MFDSYKPSECAPFSGTCSKLHVDTCIPLADGDLHTSCTSWLSAYGGVFLADARTPLRSVVRTEEGAASLFQSEFFDLRFHYAVEVDGRSLKQRGCC